MLDCKKTPGVTKSVLWKTQGFGGGGCTLNIVIAKEGQFSYEIILGG